MGKNRRGPAQATIEEAAARGVWEWETTIDPVHKLDAATLAEYVSTALWPGPVRSGREKHAYRQSELVRFQELFKSPVPLDSLRRSTDEFAVYVGMSVRLERPVSAAKRAKELRKRVLAPLSTLLNALNDREMQKEFLKAEAFSASLGCSTIQAALKVLQSRCNEHVDELGSRQRKGVTWITELCRHHVYMTALLCEFIDPDFEVARNKDNRLLIAAEILGKPIFPPKTKFVNATREHVEGWNQAFRKAKADPSMFQG